MLPRPSLLAWILPALLLGLVSGAVRTPAQAKEAVAGVQWQLGRSDVVLYDRFTVTRNAENKDQPESRSSQKLITIQGHDLGRTEGPSTGQYAPSDPAFADLPQFLAFRLTQPGEADTRIKLDWKPHAVSALRIKGSVRVVRQVPGEVHLEGSFEFKSRGKADQKDRWSLADGTATTRLVWNDTQGIVERSSIELSYLRRNLNVRGKGARRDIHRIYDYELRSLRRLGAQDAATFIAGAIEKGVAHLRTLQEEDGSFKPFKEWRIGTTALAILALASAGVPGDDKQMQKALDWLFEQEPEKTYDRATALMAIDRVYTPAAELEAIRNGNLVREPKRKLPGKRRAWVMEVAQDLMESAPSPGAWGYPTAGDLRMTFDLSNTQYAVLGMRAAYHLGFRAVDGMGRPDEDAWADMWIGVIRTCRSLQGRKGPKGRVSIVQHGQAIPDERTAHTLYEVKVPKVAGFRYATVEGHSHMSASMTCAGITCLLVARHQLLLIDCSRLNAKLGKEVEHMINGAWAWLDEHWAMDRHPHHPSGGYYYYFLYCLERSGILGNVKRIGGKDWYFEGAEQLVARQLKNGSWNHTALASTGDGDGARWSNSRKNDVPPTCFALLFLQRGTAPLQGEVTCK